MHNDKQLAVVSGHLSPFRARLLSGTSWKAGRYVQVSKVGAHGIDLDCACAQNQLTERSSPGNDLHHELW